MNESQKIREKGYKLTWPRKLILENLSTWPLTIREIRERLKKAKRKVDLVSIYRTLKLFLKLGIVREVEFGDGKKRYERFEEGNHHHHLVCERCGKVEEVNLNLEKKMLQEIKAQSDFQVERHSLEFFGFCARCQKS